MGFHTFFMNIGTEEAALSINGQCFLILKSEPLDDDYIASEGHTMGGTLSYGALGNQAYLGNARHTETVNVYANGLTVIFSSEEVDTFLECLAKSLLAKSQKNKNDKFFK